MLASLSRVTESHATRGEFDRRSGRSVLYQMNQKAGENPMLDVVYLLVGAIFLGACVLYALACEQL